MRLRPEMKKQCRLKPKQIEALWIKTVLNHFLQYLQEIPVLFSGMHTDLGLGRHREIIELIEK